jgi:hypothetical protein
MCIVYYVKIICQKCSNHIRIDMDRQKCNKANKGERCLKRYKNGGEQKESELGCKVCKAAKLKKK